jgi:phosphorylcholine metabolism protein LicD
LGDRRFIHKKNVDTSVRVLRDVVKTLDEFGIAYYLDFGTLLGAMRHDGFIPWDDDIDISLVNPEDYPKMEKVLSHIKKECNHRVYPFTFLQSRNTRKRRGNVVYHESVPFAQDDELQILKIRTNRFWKLGRGNVNMDIFCKYTYEDQLCWLAEGKLNKVSPEFLNEGFKQIDFYDISCTIPAGYDTYLTALYGDWKTPQKKWVESDGLTQEK